MASATHFLPAIFVSAIVEAAVESGMKRAVLVSASGLSPEQLATPEGPVPLSSVLATWACAMRELRDPSFPIRYAKRFAIERYPILGFAIMTARTGREAFDRMLRFSSIVSTSGLWSMSEGEETFTLIWDRNGERTLGHRIANEAVIAELMASIRQTLGADVRAVSVRFRHSAPSDTRAHESFFTTKVAWDQRDDALVLDRSLFAAIPKHANPAMSAYFESRAIERIEARAASESLGDAVARLIGDRLVDGEPALATIAKQLGKSERTLRRSLGEEGVSYRALVETVRKRRADELLRDPRVSIAEAAFALGFSEHAAFTRAYKRWTGHSPIDGRRALRA